MGQVNGLNEELEAMHQAWAERDVRQRQQVETDWDSIAFILMDERLRERLTLGCEGHRSRL